MPTTEAETIDNPTLETEEGNVTEEITETIDPKEEEKIERIQVLLYYYQDLLIFKSMEIDPSTTEPDTLLEILETLHTIKDNMMSQDQEDD